MRQPTSTSRYRAAIVALAGVALASGIAGVGIIAAQASPRSSATPAAAPAVACPIPIPLPGLCDTATPTATSTSGSSCPLPIPLPGLCDSTSPTASASPTATTSLTPSATATASPTVSATLSATPTVTATRTTTPTASPTPSPTRTAHKPLAGFSYQAATSKHPTRVVITITARGSAIKKLTKVHLAHCTWSLGSATSKHFKKGRSQIRIVVNRKHESKVGHARFHAIDKAGDDRAVSTRV